MTVPALLGGCKKDAPEGESESAGANDSELVATDADDASKTSKGYKIEVIDGVTYIDGVLIANKTYALPRSYDGNGLSSDQLTPLAQGAFDKMAAAAQDEAGLSLFVVSGFRSYETQENLYNRYVEEDGKEEADRYSARPGHSEHQTGLAADVNSVSYDFEHTAEGKWLAANCYRFGFHLRYPKDKEEITGYRYEPWHVRYVGEELARELYENDETLEEHFGITSSYEDYEAALRGPVENDISYNVQKPTPYYAEDVVIEDETDEEAAASDETERSASQDEGDTEAREPATEKATEAETAAEVPADAFDVPGSVG